MSRIVEMHDEGPLVIDREEMDDDVVAVCRCGLSNDWPHCDGSHANTRDEQDGTLVLYRREDGELERFPVDGIEAGEGDPRA